MNSAVYAVEITHSADEIRERVRAAGVVGAGGEGTEHCSGKGGVGFHRREGFSQGKVVEPDGRRLGCSEDRIEAAAWGRGLVREHVEVGVGGEDG